MKNSFILLYSFVAILFTSFACNTNVETYKGPEMNKGLYGPQAQVYKLPNVLGVIYYVAPDGNTEADGLILEAPTTIETALSKVVTGDAIIMRGGTYRTGNLLLNQGIVIQPYGNEEPIINGTFIANNWEKTGGDLWVTNWDFLFPGTPESWWNSMREEKYTPLHRFNNDGIFIDGQFLQSVGEAESVDEDTYFVDYQAGKIYIGTNPEGKTIEITAFRKALTRTVTDVHGKKSDGKGPIIRGLTFTQFPDTMVHIDGYYPQGISAETEHGKDVVGTVFENCTFSKCFRIGVFAIGDSMVMRNCKIIDSNTEGLYIVASSDVLLEKNIFANNNIERWTGFYPAAVKIFNQTHRVVCLDNLIIDHPNSNGLWYDVGNRDGVFVNNWVENIGDVSKFSKKEHMWSNFSGFFYEISSDAICAGNVFLNCEQGVFVLNSANVEVFNNTLINSMVGFGRNSRGDETDHFGWHITTGPGVDDRDNHVFVNNLFYTETELVRPNWVVWQPADMCERLNDSQLLMVNNNVYIDEVEENNLPLLNWSPADNEACLVEIFSPNELNELYPDFSTESEYYQGYSKKIFVDFDNNNFKMTDDFGIGKLIPEHVAKVMNLKEEDVAFIGAYGY